jgi:hypothetical protein
MTEPLPAPFDPEADLVRERARVIREHDEFTARCRYAEWKKEKAEQQAARYVEAAKPKPEPPPLPATPPGIQRSEIEQMFDAMTTAVGQFTADYIRRKQEPAREELRVTKADLAALRAEFAKLEGALAMLTTLLAGKTNVADMSVTTLPGHYDA